MKIEEKYNEWLNNDSISKKDKKILKKMTKQEKEESFYKDLEFGTAGIRGIMGLGTNRINKYTIGKVTVGLAKYINKKYKNGSVVVAYDTRHNSSEYAKSVCLILNYYNIKTYLFSEYTSTPELAFAVKYLNCTNGIVITSSHNSKEYNGYKVYNSLGGQVVHPEDDLIIKEINGVTDLKEVKEAPLNNELFNVVQIDEHVKYLEENKKAIIHSDFINKHGNNIDVTYTSLHGVGVKPMCELFDLFNINYHLVKKQCKYDGNFKTAPEPNPEYEKNFELSIKTAKKYNSDLILASDPDADRIGVMIKDNNEYKLLNGNLVGILFTYYVLSNKKLNKDNYVVRSLPTTFMVDAIAKNFGIKSKEVLTGCKNIAEEKNNDIDNYIFGYEESLGYMFDIDINDKNSFSSALVMIEILCYCKSQNITMSDYIDKIYKEIGYYYDYTTSIIFEGIDGNDKMSNLMNKLRNNDVKMPEIKEVIDYSKKEDKLNTNALKYIFKNNTYLTVRPSGTEPKIKLYFGSFDKKKDIATDLLNNIINEILPLFK